MIQIPIYSPMIARFVVLKPASEKTDLLDIENVIVKFKNTEMTRAKHEDAFNAQQGRV